LAVDNAKLVNLISLIDLQLKLFVCALLFSGRRSRPLI